MTYDYLGRDYSSIRSQMIEVVQDRVPGWSAAPNDFGTAMVEALAYLGDLFSYYLDRNAQEMNILTANQPYNVLSLADLFGYSPDLAQSATAAVQLSNTTDALITVPALSRFRTASGTLFESQASVDVPVGGSVTVEAWQGITETYTLGVSDGRGSQTYIAPDNGTDSRRIEVLVTDGPTTSTWPVIPRIIDAGPKDRVFAAMPDTASGRLRIVFGDGTSGQIPSAGAQLVLRYRSCSGDITVDAGEINYLDVNWESGVSYSGIQVINPAAASGGANAESVASIRRNTAASLRTQHRAVVPKDFADQARTVAGVSDASVPARLWSRPVVRVLPRAMADLTGPGADRLVQAVERHLNAVCMVGVSPSAIMATNVTFRTAIDLKLYDSASQTLVWEAAKASLEARFSYANAGFDRVISASEIMVGLAADVPGIRYATVTALYEGVTASNSPTLTPDDGEVFTLSFISDGPSQTLNLIGGIADRSTT